MVESREQPASDMELAIFLIKHITNPCSPEGRPDLNLRPFYIREAERAILKMKDDKAIDLLKQTMESYADELPK